MKNTFLFYFYVLQGSPDHVTSSKPQSLPQRLFSQKEIIENTILTCPCGKCVALWNNTNVPNASNVAIGTQISTGFNTSVTDQMCASSAYVGPRVIFQVSQPLV